VPNTSLPATEAWVQPPPTTQPIEHPQIYVWGGRLVERRATLPRVQGQKRTQHQIDIYVQWLAQSENDDLPVAIFPVLIDYLRQTIRSVQLPVNLVDDVSGEASSLTDFGENINLAYSTPVSMIGGAGNLLFNSAQIKVAAYEWFQG
jgi:hypothetical protein